MKKAAYIFFLMVLSAVSISSPLLASAQTGNTTAASLSISSPDANGNSTVSQSSSVTVPSATDPSGSTTYQYQSNGIYGCNKTGAAASSVGAFAASGSYVPVSDAAVELNTGYLVYLECSLRPLVDSLSKSATAGLIKQTLTAYNTGNNGGPQFSVNIDNENTAVATNRFVQVVQGGVLNPLNSALRNNVQTSLVRSFSASTQQPNSILSCPYTGDLNSLLNGQTFSWAGLQALQNPACSPMGAYQLASTLVNGDVANAVQNNMTQLQWGRGTYPKTTTDANGNVTVVTPGAIVLDQAEQALQAGFQKTASANDIGQMVDSLFAGIGAQAVSSAQGLAGLTQSGNGVSSYIDQVATAASKDVVTNAVNAAITVLNGVLTTVTNYKHSLDTVANTLISAIQTLRGDEAQCWSNIIQNVCVGGKVSYSNGVATCTAVGIGTSTSTPAVTLKVATSTAFSNAVIQSQITSLASQTAADISSVQTTINAVNALVAGVTNTTSQAAQNAALQQLDQLTASNSFPSQTDMTNASQQASSISSAMQILVNTTVQNWEGMDSNGNQTLPWDGTVTASTVGWCDYNNPGTLLAWESLWKK